MYEEYYNKFTDASKNPDNTKGIHVKTFSATHPYNLDKQVQDFLNLMTKRYETDFEIISISNPMNAGGFSTQLVYNIK